MLSEMGSIYCISNIRKVVKVVNDSNNLVVFILVAISCEKLYKIVN